MKHFTILLITSVVGMLIGCTTGLYDALPKHRSRDCAITEYSINGVQGTIYGNQIIVALPDEGTSLNGLVSHFGTTGTGVYVNGAAQESGVTPNNFYTPVVYHVVAEKDGYCQDYTVTATHLYKWQKCFGGSNIEYAYDLIQLPNENFIIAGETSSNDGDVSGYHGNRDIWIAETDSHGILKSQRCFGGSGNEVANSLALSYDGTCIIAGWTSSNNGDVSGYHGGSSDAWIIKLSPLGGIQWQKCLGGSSSDEANSIISTSDNGYIITGYTGSQDGDASGTHGYSSDVWVVKLDATGAIQWQKCLGGSLWDYVQSIIQTRDGGYIIAGWTGSTDGDVSGNHGLYDAWVVKLDAAGAIQWQKCYGGTNSDTFQSIVETTDGGYAALGYSNSNDSYVSGNHGGSDFWLIKFDSDGNYE